MRERLYIMRNQQGLTLVEALAALAITAFITGTAVRFSVRSMPHGGNFGP